MKKILFFLTHYSGKDDWVTELELDVSLKYISLGNSEFTIIIIHTIYFKNENENETFQEIIKFVKRINTEDKQNYFLYHLDQYEENVLKDVLSKSDFKDSLSQSIRSNDTKYKKIKELAKLHNNRDVNKEANLIVSLLDEVFPAKEIKADEFLFDLMMGKMAKPKNDDDDIIQKFNKIMDNKTTVNKELFIGDRKNKITIEEGLKILIKSNCYAENKVTTEILNCIKEEIKKNQDNTR